MFSNRDHDDGNDSHHEAWHQPPDRPEISGESVDSRSHDAVDQPSDDEYRAFTRALDSLPLDDSPRLAIRQQNMIRPDQYDKVAVFFDMSNLYFAARDLGVRIDYARLLDFLANGRRLHRAYAYMAISPEESSAIPFLTWLRRNGFRVITKPLKRFSDGTTKGDLDMELAVDLLSQAPYIDIAIIVSGDGDFTYLVDRAQRLGLRVEIASTPRYTAIELLEIADRFIDLEANLSVFALERSSHDDDLAHGHGPDAVTHEVERHGPRY
ncbi:MAG TPA: NYN domain-containing protein [Nitrolancea sp.]